MLYQKNIMKILSTKKDMQIKGKKLNKKMAGQSESIKDKSKK